MENQSSQLNVPIQSVQTPPVPPTTQSSTIQPAPEPPKQNIWKLLVIVLTILLLGMGGLVVYLFQNQTAPQPVVKQIIPIPEPSPTNTTAVNEMANWKTYINTRSNFELKYPGDWIGKSINPGPPESNPNPQSYGFIVFPNQYNSSPEAHTYINIETDGTWNKAHENFEDWLDDLKTKPYYTVQNVATGKLNQIDTTIVTGTYGGYGYPAAIKSYLFSSLDKQTYYSVSVVNETSNPYSEEISQILSTFKFTE